MIEFNNPFNTLTLNRYPAVNKNPLQAWDAADEYVLDYLYSIKEQFKGKNILIFNDSFGGLTLALNEYKADFTSDSFVSEQGLIENAKANNMSLSSIIPSTAEYTKPYDLIIIKVPKILDYLRYFLTKIRPFINQETQVIVAGMVKSMPKSIWQICEQMLGNTNTSLAKKKARLIFVEVEKEQQTTPFPVKFKLENTDCMVYNHANVFSKNSLDIGTRFLLQNLPTHENINSIIDLGCGNGVVGLSLALKYPQAKLTFTDESYMAVASAQLTAENNLPSIEQHTFLVNNCLDGFTPDSVDMIVCNPPFHQSQSIGLHIALQMFRQSFKTLKKGGIFIVIANRHLPYYSHLKRIFGKVDTIANNRKFNLFQVVK